MAKNIKILVVDDEPNIVKMVKSRLEANGYQVITAAGGQEGLIKAKAELPDLVVLDIMMPGMDGTQVGQALKLNAATNNIPVVFLTCLVEENEVPKQHIVAGNFILAKPFKAEELLEMIKKIVAV
jgi:DNA-binding response OmpR family regulator